MRSGVEGGIYKKFTESEQHQHSPAALEKTPSPAAAPESDACNKDRNIERICEVKVPAQAVQMFDSHWFPLDQMRGWRSQPGRTFQCALQNCTSEPWCIIDTMPEL